MKVVARAAIVSLWLPFLSHVGRQAAACASCPPFQPYVLSAFLAAYASSMLVHSTYVDRLSKMGARAAVLLHLLTFAAAVRVHQVRPEYDIVAWCAHATATSLLWPIAFKLINVKRRSRKLLVLWSLQGTAGDMVGCLLHPLFDEPGQTPSTLLALCLGSLVVMGAVYPNELPPPRPYPPAIPIPMLPPRSVWSSTARYPALLVLLASVSVKSMTYSASNFMPVLHLHYSLYSAGCIGGTLLSGVLADASSGVGFLVATSLCLLAHAASGWALDLWHETWYSVLFGVASSCASTMLSICICADVADATSAHGRVTAVLDSLATLGAAAVQLAARDHFPTVTVASASVLVSASALLWAEGRRQRLPWSRARGTDLLLPPPSLPDSSCSCG
jgi:hypothetical protein